MTRKTIALDIDEVLFPFLPDMNKYINSIFGTSFNLEDYFVYVFEDIWGGTKEDTARLINKFSKTESYKKIKPINGAQRGIEKLSKENDLIAISNRPIKIKEETEEQLKLFFPGKFKKVFCLGGEKHYSTAPIPKVNICKQEGASIIIEDGFRNALECAKAGIPAFLFDYPWNKNKTVNQERITRIYAPHWRNLIKHLF